MIIRSIITIVLISVSLLLGYWCSDRRPGYIELNGATAPEPVKVGGELTIDISIVVLREGCSGVFQREIVDATGHIWIYAERPGQFTRMNLGEHKDVSTAFPYILPTGIAVGPAVTYTRFIFHCNPLEDLFPIYYRSPDVKFTVIP
jgi:hypothetical protein